MEKPIHSATDPVHYNKYSIEPIEYIRSLGILEPHCVANVIKYVTRYRDKNGLEDLMKARVYLDWLIEEKQVNASSDNHEQT